MTLGFFAKFEPGGPNETEGARQPVAEFRGADEKSM